MSTSTETHVHSQPFLIRRWPSLLGVALSVTLLATNSLPHVGVAIGIAMCALVYVVWSQFTKQTRVRQWLGLAGFSVVAALALFLDHDIAMYVMAAGLIGHGVWDVVHYHRREAVSRWYAEFCAVVDVVVGLAVLALTFV